MRSSKTSNVERASDVVTTDLPPGAPSLWEQLSGEMGGLMALAALTGGAIVHQLTMRIVVPPRVNSLEKRVADLEQRLGKAESDTKYWRDLYIGAIKDR